MSGTLSNRHGVAPSLNTEPESALETPLNLVAGPARNLQQNLVALAGPNRLETDCTVGWGSISASTRSNSPNGNVEGFFVTATPNRQVLGVINGLGSSKEGQYSCRIVGTSLIHSVNEERSLPIAVLDAASALKRVTEREGSRAASGACIALAEISQHTVTFSHLGNCRALLISPENEHRPVLRFASADHTSSSPASSAKVNSVSRALSPARGDLLKDLDQSPTLPLSAGDIVVLISDGITQAVSNEKLLDVVRSELSILAASDRPASELTSSIIALETLFESEINDDRLRDQTIVVYRHGG